MCEPRVTHYGSNFQINFQDTHESDQLSFRSNFQDTHEFNHEFHEFRRIPGHAPNSSKRIPGHARNSSDFQDTHQFKLESHAIPANSANSETCTEFQQANSRTRAEFQRNSRTGTTLGRESHDSHAFRDSNLSKLRKFGSASFSRCQLVPGKFQAQVSEAQVSGHARHRFQDTGFRTRTVPTANLCNDSEPADSGDNCSNLTAKEPSDLQASAVRLRARSKTLKMTRAALVFRTVRAGC